MTLLLAAIPLSTSMHTRAHATAAAAAAHIQLPCAASAAAAAAVASHVRYVRTSRAEQQSLYGNK